VTGETERGQTPGEEAGDRSEDGPAQQLAMQLERLVVCDQRHPDELLHQSGIVEIEVIGEHVEVVAAQFHRQSSGSIRMLRPGRCTPQDVLIPCRGST
jgi:hypothetical protein